jgi:hypothetical protein
MVVGKRALIGFLGVGAAAAGLAWMLLPKNSKARKVIADKAKAVGGIFKNHIDDVLNVVGEKKARPATSRS